MHTSEFCNRVHSTKHPVIVHVKKGKNHSTKMLYIVGYSGSMNGKPKIDYIIFSDTLSDTCDTIYRTFYMDDVEEFSSLDYEIWFKDGILPHKIEGQLVPQVTDYQRDSFQK